jgi:tetratricopeptide (TPR) repeat protein
LTTTDGPLLLDFNLAHAPNTTDEAAAALRGGTLPYMAPEQLLAFLDDARWESVGPTADIYAVGLILTELLTGRRPALPDPELPLPRAIGELLDSRSAPRRSVHAANPAVPHALDAVIARCLEICPADRYQSATALAEDLEAIAAGEPLVHAENTSRVEKSLGWMSRKRAKLAAGLAVVAVLAALMFLVRPFVAAHYLREGEVANEGGRYRAAAEKLRIAQWLTPNDPAIESALGQVDFGERRYQQAHRRFTHALKLAARRPGLLTDWQTACLLYRRSQTDLDWAATLDQNNEPLPRSVDSSQRSPDLDHQRILEAMNDLQLAERLVRTDRPLLYRIGMEKLRGVFYLGVIASGRGEHVAAFEHYVHAQTLATGLLKDVPRHPQAIVWQLDVERSVQAIQRHLQSEVPLMLGLESAVPPPHVTTLTEVDSSYP